MFRVLIKERAYENREMIDSSFVSRQTAGSKRIHVTQAHRK